MKSERDAKEESIMIGQLALISAAIATLISASGCSGGRAYIGYERVDTYERTERMEPKPWKCLFVECGGVQK